MKKVPDLTQSDVDAIAARQAAMIARFAKERLDRGWSYAELALRARLNTASVHSALTGKSPNIRFVTMESLAQAFGWHQEMRNA